MKKGFTPAYGQKRFIKFAFTLAETLITLGIIGVVAAMTLPAIINQTRAKELETGLKKANSVIQAALNQMNYDEGQTVNAANYSNRRFIKSFKKYFKVSKDCGTNSCEKPSTDNGTTSYSSKTYKTYNNLSFVNMSLFDDGQIFINDGMLIMVENNTNLESKNLFISVDVNGYYKKPNRWGHDLFTFQVTDSGKLLPMGAKGTAYNTNSYCSPTLVTSLNGIACTYKALTEKDYFKNLPK